jgi:hypothetical protein
MSCWVFFRRCSLRRGLAHSAMHLTRPIQCCWDLFWFDRVKAAATPDAGAPCRASVSGPTASARLLRSAAVEPWQFQPKGFGRIHHELVERTAKNHLWLVGANGQNGMGVVGTVDHPAPD